MQVHKIQCNNKVYSYRNSKINQNMTQRGSYNCIQPSFKGSLPIELKYPDAFHKFQHLVNTDKAFKRFKLTNSAWDERIMIALSKTPDIFKTFTNMKYDSKSPGARVRNSDYQKRHPEMEDYLLDMFDVIRLTEASENYYQEILEVMNNSGTWGHIDQIEFPWIVKIATLMKLRPEILPSVENVFKSRKGSGENAYNNFSLAALLGPSQQDLLYPCKFVEFALTTDKNNNFILKDDDIRKLAPYYLQKPNVAFDALDKGNMKTDDIIVRIVES